jgi:general secretion pathway protein C
MERTARQRFWVVDLAFLAAVAWVAAVTASAAVEQAVWVAPTSIVRPARPSSSPASPPRLEVNRLAALTGLSVPADPEVPPKPEFDPSAPPVRTALPLRLLGTLIAQRPEWSLAAIEDLNTRDWGSYVEGDSLGEVRVLAIERGRVILLVDGRREFLEPSEIPAAVVASRGNAATTLANARPPPVPSNGTGIRALDEYTYEVPRVEVERALSNLNDLAMKARIVPAFRDGRAIGFKVFSIRPGSLYTHIGIQNGDVITRINGFDLDSPEKALEIYTRLKNERRVDIELERRGKPIRKTYNIQ